MNASTTPPLKVETGVFKGRSGKSRKVAFEHYHRHECVFCGLVAPDLLEVAHLNMDHSNDSVENLALMCPTCHRMHDLDLIPTAVVRSLRDQASATPDGTEAPERCSFCKRPLFQQVQQVQAEDVVARMCPCCAERHTIGVLKPDIIARMHRAKQEVDWSKLMKDAGKKAALQRRIGLLKAKHAQTKKAGVKANLTRKIKAIEEQIANLR